MITIRPIDSEPCRLAEGPLWHAARGCVYWTDIEGGAMHCHDVAANQSRQIYSGDKVGGYTFNRDGSIVLFRVKDVCWIDFDGNVLATQPVVFEGMTRFNDVIAAPDGSIFAGRPARRRSRAASITFIRMARRTGFFPAPAARTAWASRPIARSSIGPAPRRAKFLSIRT